MALNIKNADAERLAAEVAELAGETKTQAIAAAVRERLERLPARESREERAARIRRVLEEEIWPLVPEDVRGKRISKTEREEILGIGPEGYLIADTSALVAIVIEEPGYEGILDRSSGQAEPAWALRRYRAAPVPRRPLAGSARRLRALREGKASRGAEARRLPHVCGCQGGERAAPLLRRRLRTDRPRARLSRVKAEHRRVPAALAHLRA